MSRWGDDPKLDDRTAILLTIIDRLVTSMILDQKGFPEWRRHDGTTAPCFAYREPKPGEIVLCKTARISRWKIAVFVEWLPGQGKYGALLRELGSSALCRFANEEFLPLVGVDEIEVLEGVRRRVYRYARAAFNPRYNKSANRWSLFGGLDFDGDTMRIAVRAHIFVNRKRIPGGGELVAVPYTVSMPWSSKTRVKDVVAALAAAGYPTREFEFVAEAPR